jgi:glycosyltransferase involved in cell wall biosynthesis
MLNNETLIFLGTIKKVANCGESMKNHLFIDRYKEVYKKVITVDLWHPRKHFYRVAWALLVVLFHPRSRVVVSISVEAADHLIRLLQLIGCKNIYYWAVGGTLHKRIIELGLSPETYKKVKKIYAQSDQIVEGLAKMGIYNCVKVVNSKRIEYLPDISKRDIDKVKFVFLSRVHPDKGCSLIVKAADWLNKNGYKDKFSVDFYGKFDEDYKPVLLCEMKDVDNVQYKGFLDLTNGKGYDTLAQYDMMLFPTWWDGEGFPGVIIDAYIAGVPIIASDWNCNTEVVDDEIGIIIRTQSQDDLTNSMKDVLDGKYNLKNMAKKCQERAMAYDNRNVLSIENLEKLGML